MPIIWSMGAPKKINSGFYNLAAHVALDRFNLTHPSSLLFHSLHAAPKARFDAYGDEPVVEK